MKRAIASRTVMKLSGKCRSGREGVRPGVYRPSGRGGKTPHAFRNNERVAAEHDGDMVMPAFEAAAFVMVQPEFALEVFIRALGAPALHHQSNEWSAPGRGR